MIYLHNQDCVKFGQILPDNFVDVWFLDPPYNTKNKKDRSVKYDRNKDFERKNWRNFFAEWDDITNYYEWCVSWLTEVKRTLKPKGIVYICGSFHNIPDVALALRSLDMYTVQWIQWCIPNAFPNLAMTKQINANQTIIMARKGNNHYYDKEAAKRYNNGKNLRDYWLINNDTQSGKKWKHPSKKPIDLVYRAVDISTPKQNDVVIADMFAGSGTTGVAAEQLARQYSINTKCYLNDNKVEYIDMMKERLNQ